MSTFILTTYYNPTNSLYALPNFNRFLENLDKLNLLDKLYVCEIGSIDKQEIKHVNNYYHIQCDAPLWHKENGINHLIKQLPHACTKIIVSDNDLLFHDPDWFAKTERLLDGYNLVQPYDYVKYSGPEPHLMDTIEISMCKKLINGDIYYTGNPGLCVAYRKEYLDAIGGLFDLAIVGGADTINFSPFISDYIEYNIFDRVCLDNRIDLLNYIKRAKLYLKHGTMGDIAYLEDSVITHLYHGWRKNRQYTDRYNIIKDINFDDFFYRNEFGIIDTVLNTQHQIEKYKEINKFFNIRNQEELLEDKPLIVNTNKYNIDDDILWLSNYNVLSFSNIAYVEIVFNQTIKLKYLQMIHNNQHIEHEFIDNKFLLKLENPRTLIIDSDSFTPAKMNTGRDERKLSIYISDIKIISTRDDTLSSYELKDVI